jgi:hypothetical protein
VLRPYMSGEHGLIVAELIAVVLRTSQDDDASYMGSAWMNRGGA